MRPEAWSSAAEIAKRYRFPRDLTGKGECIAILAFGGAPCFSDFVHFFEQHIGAVPDLRFENVTTTNPSHLNSRQDVETALDIQIAGALAPGARIVAYFSTNDEKGWVDTVFRAIHDDENRPTVLSISWGATEDSWSVDAIQTLNKMFEDAAALGITVCVASGDEGCAMDLDGHCRVTFPASSPFVLACGGTSPATEEREVVWKVKNANASGGGISDRIARPCWQPPPSQVLLPPIPSRRNPAFDGRQLPDVSGIASDFYTAYVGGAYRNGAAGTSAVAPVWSALIARLNQGLRVHGLPRIGHFHPVLYTSRSVQQSFRSVVTGHNDPFGDNGYQARPGWNFCTGWGSPDGTALFEALCSQLVPGPPGSINKP